MALFTLLNDRRKYEIATNLNMCEKFTALIKKMFRVIVWFLTSTLYYRSVAMSAKTFISSSVTPRNG